LKREILVSRFVTLVIRRLTETKSLNFKEICIEIIQGSGICLAKLNVLVNFNKFLDNCNVGALLGRHFSRS
jgi:hypothetical protein